MLIHIRKFENNYSINVYNVDDLSIQRAQTKKGENIPISGRSTKERFSFFFHYKGKVSFAPIFDGKKKVKVS